MKIFSFAIIAYVLSLCYNLLYHIMIELSIPFDKFVEVFLDVIRLSLPMRKGGCPPSLKIRDYNKSAQERRLFHHSYERAQTTHNPYSD